MPEEASASPRQLKRINFIQSSLKPSSKAVLESEIKSEVFEKRVEQDYVPS